MRNKLIHKVNYGTACAHHIVYKLQIVESLAILQHSCLAQNTHLNATFSLFSTAFYFFLPYADLLIFIKTSHVFYTLPFFSCGFFLIASN